MRRALGTYLEDLSGVSPHARALLNTQEDCVLEGVPRLAVLSLRNAPEPRAHHASPRSVYVLHVTTSCTPCSSCRHPLCGRVPRLATPTGARLATCLARLAPSRCIRSHHVAVGLSAGPLVREALKRLDSTREAASRCKGVRRATRRSGVPDRIRTDRSFASLRAGRNRHRFPGGLPTPPDPQMSSADLPPSIARGAADERSSGVPDRIRTDDIQLGKLWGGGGSPLVPRGFPDSEALGPATRTRQDRKLLTPHKLEPSPLERRGCLRECGELRDLPYSPPPAQGQTALSRIDGFCRRL